MSTAEYRITYQVNLPREGWTEKIAECTGTEEQAIALIAKMMGIPNCRVLASVKVCDIEPSGAATTGASDDPVGARES